MNWKTKIIVILAILGCVVSCAGIVLCVQKDKEIKHLTMEYKQLEVQLKLMEEQFQYCSQDFKDVQAQLLSTQKELDTLKKN